METKVIVYARNACYDIARNLGLDYFFLSTKMITQVSPT